MIWPNRRGSETLADQLRVPPEPFLLLFVVPALGLCLGGWSAPNLPAALGVAVLLYVLAGLLWAVDCWKPEIGRWATLVALVSVVVLTRYWLGLSGSLALLTIPVVLAVVLVDFRACVIIAGLASAPILLPLVGVLARVGAVEAGVALVLVWLTVGLMLIVQYPVYSVLQYSWANSERATDLLEQARNRQAEFRDTLDALSHANRELALANERLAAMRLVAEEARKSKASFVANVSHEFRTPLNIIVGLAEVLLRAPEAYGLQLPSNVQEDLRILHRNCEHLSSMINDVLDLSQVEAGRLAVQREWVNLAQLIESALLIVRPLVDRKRLSFRAAVPQGLSPVYCDPRRIRQVILNLLSNAARHTERGGITIEVQMDGNQVVVHVNDTGPGISPQRTETIFEPFGSGSGERTTDQRGSGLGLSISRQFIEMHEGHIWLDTEEGIGSTFSFSLPVSPVSGPIAPPHRWIAEDWIQRTRGSGLHTERPGRRFILCDSSRELYPVMDRYGEEAEFVQTESPAQALDALQHAAAQAIVVNSPNPADLLALVDEVCAGRPDAPVIGCSFPSRKERALGAGAVGHLVKPVQCQDLEGAIAATGRLMRRVLVVDDDADTLHLMARMLRMHDNSLEIIAVGDGQQALAEMHRARPDLVLLDIVLPVMDGWQVLAAKAEDEAIRGIPTIVITAQDATEAPFLSKLVLATAAEGLSLGKLMRCCAVLSALLTQPNH